MGVEEFIKPARCFSEEFELLLEVDIYAAEENWCILYDFGVIQEKGQVHRNHDDVMVHFSEGIDEFAVAQAILAIESIARTRNYVNYLHVLMIKEDAAVLKIKNTSIR